MSDDPLLFQYGCTEKPYSDCTASAGTTGFTFGFCRPPSPPDSLSSATTVSTRSSVPCTSDTAEAPREWPMIATRVVRPGVAVLRSGLRSNRFQYGLKPFTDTSLLDGFGYGLSGVERKKLSASWVP